MFELPGAYTALITPFTDDGSAVDAGRLACNVEVQSLAGMHGVVPCGTTGETPTLSEAEYRLVVERTIDEARPRGLVVIAGAGSNCTARAVALHRFARSAGAHAALHVTPYYNKPSAEGLYRHFMTIAEACELPIVLYNVPGRTGAALPIETIERLAGHEHIVAIKEASGTLAVTEQVLARTSLTVLSGDDPLTLPLAVAGAKGVISVLGNLVPDRVAALGRAILAGQWERARILHRSLLPLARALLSADTNPVPVKTALRLDGRDSGALRLPLCPPSAEVARHLAELLASLEREKLETEQTVSPGS